MIDLTQKLLELDKKSIKALQSTGTAAMQMKKEADFHFEQKMKETEQRFEAQRERDLEELSQMLEAEKEKAVDTLHRKMTAFHENVDIDRLVEHLAAMAKERICH